MKIMTIQDLSKEIERGRKIYGCLKNVEKTTKVFESGVNVGELVTFWMEVGKRDDAITLAKKYREILYNSSVAETEGCVSLLEEVGGIVYCVRVYFP